MTLQRLGLVMAVVLSLPASAAAGVIFVPGGAPTIQSAILAANPGDEIFVAPGTYYESINLLGKAITVRSTGGAAVTAIDASTTGGSVIYCVSGEDLDTVIQGFTVQHGSGVLSGFTRQGLGMIIVDSSPTLLDCVFENLSVAPFSADGGAIFCSNASPRLAGCVFENNTATFGGAILNSGGGSPIVSECIFQNNTALLGDGGAILSISGKITLDFCVFRDNTASFRGGAVKTSTNGIPNAASCMINCLFVGNSAANGGAIFNHSGHTTITNCTVTDNSATMTASAIHGESAHVANCIIWNNGPAPPLASSIWSITYSVVDGGYAGAGNLDLDPQFVDAALGVYSLAVTSPCIDAGLNNADIDFVAAGSQPLPLVDLAQQPRFADVLTVIDSGVGVAPIVDMGCYERQGAPSFARGDTNVDGLYNIADPIHLLTILFGGMGLVPACTDSCDANDDGLLDIADAIFALTDLFGAGPSPAAPFPDCGSDPTADALDCASDPACL